MKLVSFSVENYRSITKARKIPLSDYSLLIGANNEGKSNILHALALAMSALVSWHTQIRRTIDGRIFRLYSSFRSQYDWIIDFPIAKQNKADDNSKTKIILEFQLDEKEVIAFRDEIRSNLNGTLPIVLTFGKNRFDLSVQKPGKGSATLNKKSTRIADFVSRRIRFEYIPAIRTASSAGRVISQLLDNELRTLESNPEYVSALDKIEELQKPIFDDVAGSIRETITGFLPNVRAVRLTARREARNSALRRDVEILIDDGQETRLERKGDGVQSLVALALARHTSEQANSNATTVIAIEEPESHLHPNAIHEVRSVIEDLSAKNQIILSSHSPLFVNINNLSNTIIVKESKARCAKHVSEIREALGVRFSDNLYNASVVLLVEGALDALALRSILPALSDKLASAFQKGVVTIDHLSGASGLTQKAAFYKASACNVQCFMDNDHDGKVAMQKAIEARTLKISDVNLCTVPHLPESELEDLYDRNLYREIFLTEFGVDPKTKIKTKSKLKWSLHMEKLFHESGKPWNETIKANAKQRLADFAAANPKTIIKTELESPIRSFINSVEAKLP